MNTKGMTLIELLVYMAIAALLLTPVIMLMQNSSLNMARDAVNTDLRISGRDILNIMYDDLRNTGFKLENASGGVVDEFVQSVAVITAPNPPNPGVYDSSSFLTGDGAGAYDALTIYKGRLTAGGVWDGYDIVRYYVSGDTLNRSEHKYNKADDYLSPTTKDLAIATNVEALQFLYSKDLNCWYYDADPTCGVLPNTDYDNKKGVQYIKVAVVTVDKKKLAPVKTSLPITVGNYPPYAPDDQYLREISEIVVPIPNNGLFP